jgi:hypothetical protein
MAATQDQINAYLYNIREAYISYGNNLANAQRLGRTDLSCYQMKFRLLQYFVRIMTDYFDSSNYETINFFTVNEIKDVMQHINNICKTNYTIQLTGGHSGLLTADNTDITADNIDITVNS